MLARLHHHGVSGQKRRKHLLHNLPERIVPWRDAGNDTHGFTQYGAFGKLRLEFQRFRCGNVGLNAGELILAV